MSIRHLIFILGDQLSFNLSSLSDADPKQDRILMCEVAEETGYVPHHKKKLVFILSAMRHHAKALEEQGWTVDYVQLDDPENTGSFVEELSRSVDRLSPEKVILTEPSERRVLNAFRNWQEKNDVSLDIREDTRFLASHEDFSKWADGRKLFRMEHFYRDMRKAFDLLMDGDDPAGGEWNFDQDNRKPASHDLFMPKRLKFETDDITKAVINLVNDRFSDNFGSTDGFWFAVTRADAERAVDHFLDDALSCFGDYQDAMLEGHAFLYHSLISPYINVGLLDPLDVCRRAETAYREGDAPINAVEGFIRQILGWREYVRGIYWLADDDYVHQNALNAKRPLPGYFWSADTRMNCIRQVVSQTRDEAYAHHIQRLMVTGVFSLIAGLNPHEVHEWYLAVYADAFEWVEAPNVIGMALYADGGQLGSKPYAASGAYINRMSDYCKNCYYAVTRKTEDNACPFNALYWDFLVRNKDTLKSNGRIARVYSTWEKMDKDKRDGILKRAEDCLDNLESL